MKRNLLIIFVCLNIYFSATAQWTQTNYSETMEVHGIHFINEQIGFAVGFHQVYRTIDGGQNWTEIASNIFINGPIGVWFINENVGFIIGADGGANPQVSKTINGGTSWTTTNLPVGGFGFNDPNKIFFFDNNTGYIVCRGGRIYKTINQGVGWSELTSGVTEDITSVHFPTSGVGYASLMYSSTLLKTINSGNSWSLMDLGELVAVNDIYFTGKDTGYLACSSSKILKTTDGGISWTVFNFGTSDVFYTIEFTSDNIGYVAGSSGTIATTTNAGTTWDSGSGGITNLLYCMDFPTSETGYIGTLGPPGKIIKTINGGGILSIAEQNETSVFEVYPNPASNVITIKASNNFPDLTYTIINQSGKQVLAGKLTNETTSVDITQLKTGVYLIRVGEHGQYTLKVVKR